MPLGVETKRTRRPRRRRRNPRGGLNNVEKSQVKAIIANQDARTQEKKTFDLELNHNITIDWSSTNTLDLSAPAQGDGSSQRGGDHIQPVSLFLRFELATPDNTNRVRVVIWRQAVTTATLAAALSTIVQYFTAGDIDRDIYSPYKVHTEITNFKVLYDKNFFLSSGLNTQTMIEELYFDLRKMPQVEFADGITTGQNHYFISYLSDSAVTPPTIKGWSRFRYYDA